MTSSDANDSEATPDLGLPGQIHPDNTRPIIIGFHNITAQTTQILYTIDSCDGSVLGNVQMNLVSGGNVATSKPNPLLLKDIPAINVPPNWVQNPLRYSLIDLDTGQPIIPSTLLPIPHNMFIPECVEALRKHKHHEHHAGHEGHETR